MFSYTLKLFLRNFRRNIVINSLNLLGLAAAMAACMMIIIYLDHENSYDASMPNVDRVVRVNTDLKVGEGQEIRLATASWPVAAGLAEEIGAVESFVRLRLSTGERPVFVGEKIFLERDLAWADSTFFRVLGARLLLGDPATALAAPMMATIAESTARRFFGDADPIGREIRLSRNRSYTVTGVYADMAGPSHLPSFSLVCSIASLDIEGGEYWVGRSMYASYLLLLPGADAAAVQPLADAVFDAHAAELMKLLDAESSIHLQPVREIHFDTGFDFAGGFTPPVPRRKLLVFALLAVFIVVVAAVSFVNMATARSGDRARQVGISKAVGASRLQLAAQFVGEFIIIALVAAAVAFLLVEALLPFFADFTGRELTADFDARPWLPASFVGLALLVGVLAGLYPAAYLTSFLPRQVIHERLFASTRRSRLRPALITFQFAVTIGLILCTLTVANQVEYMNGRDPGFDREQLIALSVGPEMTRDDCETFRREAIRHPGIVAGTCSSHLPTTGHMEFTYEVPEPEAADMLMTRMFAVDGRFIETMGMELVAGRNFDENDRGRYLGPVILNETAVRELGYEDPVGRRLDADPSHGDENSHPVTIVGVVRDINFESLHHGIEPMALVPDEGRPAQIAFRLHPERVEDAIAHLRETWRERFPRAPFRYIFLDDNFARMYDAEIRLGGMFTFFTGLALVISVLGLVALVAYSAERRMREISIRKVMGASMRDLFSLLSGEYVRLVLVANVVAWPVAWWGMRRWAESFAYRAPFPWWLYPGAAAGALLVALATAGIYTLRAVHASPADTLRTE
ncbi:MAG: ABC transporter permease [Candidatus Krumholzibacteriota bacterium]|nr:ABC transporter permease [Candidatus Krumholzibacteriota bacterium]